MENILGLKFRRLRENANMTQLELSKKLGYESMQFVSLFERGLSKIPMGVIGKLFVIFNVPMRERKIIIKSIVGFYETQITDEIIQGEKSI